MLQNRIELFDQQKFATAACGRIHALFAAHNLCRPAKRTQVEGVGVTQAS